jgi:hypothetical protein
MTHARDVIISFLGDRSEPICAPCLSKLTSLPSIRVVEGWRDLAELSADFVEVERGHCADCGEMGAVLTRVKGSA